MAFCTNCGASVNGAFCQQCGTPAGVAAPAAAPVPPPPVAAVPGVPPGAVAPKKISPIVWVLIVLVGLFVVGGMLVAGAGYFFVRSVAKNPASTFGAVIRAANPNLDVISVNEDTGTITVKDKTNGKIITLNFDDVKKGRIKIDADDNGKTASFEIGSGADKIPSWVPSYPGAKVQGNFAGKNGEEEGGMFSFNSSDAPEKIIGFYTEELKSAGFKINTTATTADTNMVAAEDEGTKRNVVVTVGKGSDGANVSVVYGTKK